MRTIALYTFISILGGVSLVCGAAMAQQRPPAPDFSAMATQLGVPETALMTCLGPRPEPGQRPDRPDPSAVSSCLNQAGYEVSAKSAQSALAKPPQK